MTMNGKAEMTYLLASMWDRNRPLMLERLATLDQAADAALAHTLGGVLREDALNIAHKLAGSLGMFGFPAGTDLARELELELERTTIDADEIRSLTVRLRHTMFPEG